MEDDCQYAPFTKAEKLSNRIIRIPGLNPGKWTLNGTNTYLVGTGKRRILIDCGTSEKTVDYLELLAEVMEKNDVEQISVILLTHGHEDHYGGIPAVLHFLAETGKEVPKVYRSHSNKMVLPQLPSPHCYTAIKDGEIFACDGASLKALYTPGHCDDHTIFWLPEEKSVFSGDCILGDTDTTIDDMLDYMKAVEKMVSLAPVVLYPGHGNVVVRPMTKLEGTLRVKKKESNEILNMLENHHPRALCCEDITKKLYNLTCQKEIGRYTKYVQQHLVRLCRLTRLTKRDVNGREHYLFMFGAA